MLFLLGWFSHSSAAYSEPLTLHTLGKLKAVFTLHGSLLLFPFSWTMQVGRYGCLYKLEVHFLGVPIFGPLIFGNSHMALGWGRQAGSCDRGLRLRVILSNSQDIDIDTCIFTAVYVCACVYTYIYIYIYVYRHYICICKCIRQVDTIMHMHIPLYTHTHTLLPKFALFGSGCAVGSEAESNCVDARCQRRLSGCTRRRRQTRAWVSKRGLAVEEPQQLPTSLASVPCESTV